ncbi:DUF551 domain-containing protein [Raoultella ornithinolytica]|uniref:DUF551 domain-containing protein n=2 Tax=Raoultella ornithinolytica TaxID=54291 RepID=UPI001C7DD58D|nr:DUF551 domain-containing protein [Raoultella ornithinolytica]
MTSKLTRLTDDELTETLRLATSGYPLPACVEGNLRQAFAELQERRKADSEPVATLDVQSRRPDGNKFALVFSSAAHKLPDDVYFLYRHAQQPVVPEVINKLLAILDRHTVQLGWGEKPITLAELVITRDGSDELEACRAAMLQAGISAVIPDGYVMVPKEPTQAMCAAFNDSDYGRKSLRERYVAMLAAAAHDTPALNSVQSVATVPGKWVPVSERMPETDGNYWGWWSESKRQGPVWFIKSELQAQFQSHEITHWMPLPADPQEVNHG